MPKVTVIYGEVKQIVQAKKGDLLGDAVGATGLPLEQPCAGRGTCGLCKVLDEGGLSPPDEVEEKHLTPGEIAVGNRLACRARIEGDTTVILTPIVVYSNKIFHASLRYKLEKDVPLGLAVDLGTTTVAAYLTMLDDGEVCLGAASLNQQSIYGADVISRMAAAVSDEVNADRLQKLAIASINQSIDALKLSKSIRERIVRADVVCNPPMHHLLNRLPVKGLTVVPFQPYTKGTIPDAGNLFTGILPASAQVRLPPLIGGFVGSDALACLGYFDFDTTTNPIAAIDLGTNGEVLVTNGKEILTASTAAGPAFEGVNISCGTRAVDGAITRVALSGENFVLETIGDQPPVGLTGSGLISAIHQLIEAGLIEKSGRIKADSPLFSKWGDTVDGIREIHLTPDGKIRLTQSDIRELQKAKGAIRAAIEILMKLLDVGPQDLKHFYLTGSFGGAIDIGSIIGIGMIPPVNSDVVVATPNGAGFGAAMYLTDEGMALAEKIARRAQQIDLDRDADFIKHYIESMEF
ncbi:MAG: ASKHA domain-containing protein [Anaerolineales bacterium]|jgi:uncharacterized 2Fe-2S/4Fe-4S cluster protein (DUF4445 family)